MSKDELKYNLYLLENLHKYGQEALIEADKLEFLNKDGNWENLENLGLYYIPIIVNAVKIDNPSKDSIIYELCFKLLIPRVEIVPEKIERIIISKSNNKEKPYTKNYISIKNNEIINEDILVKYDNNGINTFSKIKNTEIMGSFKRRSRQKLYQAAGILSENFNSNLSKKLTIKK